MAAAEGSIPNRAEVVKLGLTVYILIWFSFNLKLLTGVTSKNRISGGLY